ncbi:adenosylcobinamide-GDP ribazoletransferase [Tellurirhabdus rosea]|uniref:adenosylcobinamide-GDP ribazoletransferase n=1 Tax=Tellurirhabdus rosea TaxID=2674997 RepID=UPI00224E433B|nr:adenosylcobinamide-GDP ribazoletransferase [Tellurirhabdus rosea]
MRLFFTALMFYTRLPVPKNIDHSEDLLNRSTVFFPIIGWIVGGIAAGTYWLGTVLFPPEMAVLFSLIASIWATGAFHEDGFADVCDGFGGGWSSGQILTIMKDSRLGTYGFVGLALLLAVKYMALENILETERYWYAGTLMYISGHSLSRFMAITVIRALPYAREDAESKAKPISKGIETGPFWISFLLAIVPLVALIYLTELWIYATFLLPMWLGRTYLKRLYQRWLGGYTGDGLGAIQQLTEVIWYLSLVSIKWISL